LSEDYRVAIPTGIGKIDETLEGGLGKGELGCIIGSSSFGKTSLTTAMASYAATFKCPQNNNDGYKVLQIVFEDRVKQIQRKHMGRITGIEAKDLSKPGVIDKVKEQLAHYEDREMLQKNLRIIRLPSGEKTADDIKRLIIKLRNVGFSPDLVIVDYFECLLCKGDASDDKLEKEGKTMRKFESMAGELNIGIWIPVQGTKDSLNVEVVTMDKAGGSFKKIQIAHIVMSIARTVEDIEESKATIAILKNRAGKAGKVFNNVEFNNGTCRISTDNVDAYDSMFAFNKKKEQDQKELQSAIFKTIKH
jgi:replicative DNA helicase